MIWRYSLLWVGCTQTAQGVYESRADPWSWVSILFLGSGFAALAAFAHLNCPRGQRTGGAVFQRDPASAESPAGPRSTYTGKGLDS